MSESPDGDYGKSVVRDSAAVTAPVLSYLPPMPKTYRPKIALIGAGGDNGVPSSCVPKNGFGRIGDM